MYNIDLEHQNILSYLNKIYKEETENLKYIELPSLIKKTEKLNKLIQNITNNIKEVFISPTHFLRYDLTLPYILSGLESRVEVGKVYRLAPTSSYRYTEFIQADIDCKYKNNKQIKEVFFYQINFLNRLPINYVIKINHLSYFLDLLNVPKMHIKVLLKEIDSKGYINNTKFEIESKIELYIKENYGTTFTTIPFKVDCSIVRGLYIYTGLVYEIYFSNCKYAFGAGGQYILKELSNETYFGGSLGLSRIAKYIQNYTKTLPCIYFGLDKKQIKRPEYIFGTKAYRISSSLKRIFKKFSSTPYIILVGPKEYVSNQFILRNMSNRTEMRYNKIALIEAISQLIKSK
jgi:histidyl-tRNA synthetase